MYLQIGNWMILDLKSSATGLSIPSLFIWLIITTVLCFWQKLWRVWDFTYFQAHKSACHSFMGAGRRQETPGSETNDFIVYSNSSRQIISIYTGSLNRSSPRASEEARRWHLYTKWFAFQEQSSDLREFEYSWWSVSMPALRLRERHYFCYPGQKLLFALEREQRSLSFKAICCINIFEKIVQNRLSVPLFANDAKLWKMHGEVSPNHFREEYLTGFSSEA